MLTKYSGSHFVGVLQQKVQVKVNWRNAVQTKQGALVCHLFSVLYDI